MECHRELGPGLDEAFYHELLCEKLKTAGIPHQFKPKGRLIHRGIIADEFEADVLVSDELVLELKVLRDGFAPEHWLQIICYLKFWRSRAGLLFDFGKESLVHQRVVFSASEASFDADHWLAATPASISDRAALELVSRAISGILDTYGLGYRDTTYRGLLFAELTVSGVQCVRDPITSIHRANSPYGESKLPCLVLPGRCALYVNALRDTHQAADRAVLQTYLRYLKLPWGIVVNFGKRGLDIQLTLAPHAKYLTPPLIQTDH